MMATGITRPLVRTAKKRMFSAAAAAQSEAVQVDREPKAFHTKLGNGLLVGTIETPSPVARIAVVVNAGSRFESASNLGIAHFFRHAPQLGTDGMSSLAVTRTMQALGSDVSVVGTRENILFKSSVSRNYVADTVNVLRHLSTKHVFKHWAVADLQAQKDGIALDLAIAKSQPNVQLMELLHAAAFRETLGRSLYMPDYVPGKFTVDKLGAYVAEHFVAGRLALVGVGIDHEELEHLGGMFELNEASGASTQKAVYHGSELLQNTGGQLSYIAVAMGGPSVGSKDLLAAEVLKQLLGVGPHVKYSGGTSNLAKATAQVTDNPHSVSAFTANYSDAGLFGFTVIAKHTDAVKVLEAAAGQLKAVLGGVKQADVDKAKSQLKSSIAMQFEDPDEIMNYLAEQTLHSDKILTPADVYKMVDAVTLADVNNAAKAIAATKPSMAATGNTIGIPYVDTLLK